jgi:hypothetical protein
LFKWNYQAAPDFLTTLQKPPANGRNCAEENSAENEVLVPSVYGSAKRQSVSNVHGG